MPVSTLKNIKDSLLVWVSIVLLCCAGASTTCGLCTRRTCALLINFNHMSHELRTVEQWTEFLKEKLNASQFLSLATRGEEGPWVCPLYFAFDEEFNLY